jgi:hypothetical protein
MPGEQDRGGTPRWDPFELWRLMLPSAGQVAQAAQAAQARPLAIQAEILSKLGGRTALQGMVDATRTRLVGRRLTFGSGADALTLTLADVAATADPLLMAVGQLGEVTLTATQVKWREFEFSAARATARNTHTRPGARPLLIAAPVDLVVTVSDTQLGRLVAERSSRIELQITEDARVVARLRRHPAWGWVEVEPSVEGSRVMFRPVRLGTARKASRILPTLPHVHFGLPLGDDLHVTRLDVGPQALDIHIRLSEWRLDYLDSLSFIDSR